MRTGNWLILAVVGAALAAACSDDESSNSGSGGSGGSSAGTGGSSAGTGGSSAGTGGSGGSGGSSAGSGGSGGTAGGSAGADGSAGAGGATGGAGGADGGLAARGEYLVKAVGVCGDCHTPRDSTGALDMSKWLAGVPVFVDIDPSDTTKGAIASKNLTPDGTTGLGSWTDAEIKAAFLDGVSKDGSPLFWFMPYYVFHNMTAQDADAIVAYLRSIPAVSQAIPARQDLGFPITAPATPLPLAGIPDTTLPSTDSNYASAERGKYLAAQASLCIECHTEDSAPGTAIPLDVTKFFQGNKQFPAALLGLPSPPFPAIIYSRNLTPTANGIAGWTAAMVQTTLKMGVDKDGIPLCPPMPAGTHPGFGDLTDQDALDIGHYVTTLPPVDNGVIPNCDPTAVPDGGSDGAAGAAGAPNDGGAG